MQTHTHTHTRTGETVDHCELGSAGLATRSLSESIKGRLSGAAGAAPAESAEPLMDPRRSVFFSWRCTKNFSLNFSETTFTRQLMCVFERKITALPENPPKKQAIRNASDFKFQRQLREAGVLHVSRRADNKPDGQRARGLRCGRSLQQQEGKQRPPKILLHETVSTGLQRDRWSSPPLPPHHHHHHQKVNREDPARAAAGPPKRQTEAGRRRSLRSDPVVSNLYIPVFTQLAVVQTVKWRRGEGAAGAKAHTHTMVTRP